MNDATANEEDSRGSDRVRRTAFSAPRRRRAVCGAADRPCRLGRGRDARGDRPGHVGVANFLRSKQLQDVVLSNRAQRIPRCAAIDRTPTDDAIGGRTADHRRSIHRRRRTRTGCAHRATGFATSAAAARGTGAGRVRTIPARAGGRDTGNHTAESSNDVASGATANARTTERVYIAI